MSRKLNLETSDAALLASPVTLPCGIQVQNRLVKVAMYEHLCPFGGGPPNLYHTSLYSKWGQGKWGIIITGNVQVSPTHLGIGADITLPPINPTTSGSPRDNGRDSNNSNSKLDRGSNERIDGISNGNRRVYENTNGNANRKRYGSGNEYDIKPWAKLAAAIHACPPSEKSALALLQLSHNGRQSGRILGGRMPWVPPLAPSAKRVGENINESLISRIFYELMFQTPKAMTKKDIDFAIEGFKLGVRIALEAGFDGVQLHGSHGYLITQFISPKTNLRTDEYGRPLKFLQRLATEIREIVPASFVLAVKLNAADYVEGGMTEEQSLHHLQEIATWQLFDIIEVSGGDYENPEFTDSSRRQTFYSNYSRKAAKIIADLIIPNPPLILLTGSLRSRSSMASVIRNEHAALIGLARPSVVIPEYARLLTDETIDESDVPHPFEPKINMSISIPKLVGASVATMWYNYEMMRIGRMGNVSRIPIHHPSSLPAILRFIYCFLLSFFMFFQRLVGLSSL